MNILVMGATGYLGKHILDFLSGKNSIFVIYNKKPPVNNKGIFCYPKEEYVELFRDNHIDWLINCIGVYQKEDRGRIVEGNMIFPLQVMTTAVEYEVKNIININTALPENLNLYSFTKRELGRFGEFYSMQYKINFYNLLVEMFYGADEPRERFFSSVIDKIKDNRDVSLTEGKQKRDIVHVKDVCQAVCIVMDSGLEGYYDIPVGSGEGHSIREMVEYIYGKMNSSSKLLFGAVPMRKNEGDSIADISLLSELGYKPEYSWKKGLDEMLRD